MLVKYLGMALVVSVLSACSRSTLPVQDDLYARSGTLCTAANSHTKHTFSAWATQNYVARGYALSRCQSRSGNGVYCKITSCLETGASTEVASTRWYTCYVVNHARKGIWTSTSHTRLNSVKVASLRCQRYSGNAAACYLSHCRIW